MRTSHEAFRRYSHMRGLSFHAKPACALTLMKPQMQRPLRLGTRSSKLALAQTAEVKERLATLHGWDRTQLAENTDVIVIRTSGDKSKAPDLSQVGGKGLFVKELEDALLDGVIDVAIHSMKDMLPVLPSSLEVAAMLPRADPHDALLLREGASLKDLRQGATLGTSSPRRRAQILSLRPDVNVVPFRGNVDTRLAKLSAGEVDATILALAGLSRLDLAHEASEVFLSNVMLPAVAQGAIGLEIRKDDDGTREQIAALNDLSTHICVSLERAFLEELQGSCRTPIAGLAEVIGHHDIAFRGQVLHPQGLKVFNVARQIKLDAHPMKDALVCGRDAARALRAQAGHAYFDV